MPELCAMEWQMQPSSMACAVPGSGTEDAKGGAGCGRIGVSFAAQRAVAVEVLMRLCFIPGQPVPLDFSLSR
jgi:hypothetical protein